MGIYLNPGKENYQMTINSEIFVDKSEMLLYLNSVVNTQQRFVCVSRPRRFGKTIAADMICAYYDRYADSRAMFEKLKLSEKSDNKQNWDVYLGKFDVLRFVITDFMWNCTSVSEMIQNLTDEISDDLLETYSELKSDKQLSLRYILNKVYEKTKRQFVIVIDEWDAVFRIWKNNKEEYTKYLNFIRDLLKDRSYVALAYMTGILPIKKYGQHSALNMFTEYSMMYPQQLAPFTGFTENEVKELCNKFGRDFDEIKAWYDGYKVSGTRDSDTDFKILKETGSSPKTKHFELYSPLSVVQTIRTGSIRNYWNKTETYEALAEFIRRDYDGLKESVALLIDGGKIKIDTSTYQNDMVTFTGKDDVLSLLIHLGYLGFDDETSEVFVPNKEILDEFKTSTKSSEWVSTFESFELSQKLLKATWEMDSEKVAELLEKAHNKVENKTYNDEAALSYAVQYAYYASQKYYTNILELDTGKGYADIVYLPSPLYPDKPALLIELKYNKDVKGAIEQIKQQNYPDRLVHYKGNVLLIGINYNKDIPSNNPDFKHHSCVIEKA